MVLDEQLYYEMTDELDEVLPGDYRRLWAAASLRANVTEMGDERVIPCAQGNLDIGVYDNCRLPVLFHRPTAIQVLDDQTDSNRDVNVLAAASTSAVIVTDSSNLDINSANNPTLGEGKTGLIVRIDYPGISVLDQTSNNDQGEVSVTGSIVFVADHSALANHLWDKDIAEEVGYQQCSSPYYVQQGHNCWNSDSQGLSDAQGDTTWNGNGQYFQALMQDMMEKDNEDISTKITRFNDNFFIVFDESRHVASPLSAPFTEAMGAIVLLTSDVVLKWLIILNLFALLAIAIMVVPEKENWRHVFDLTRFRERPTKVDAAQYQMRTREALLSKVRQFNDLTRDEFMRKSPAEIMQMVRDLSLIHI